MKWIATTGYALEGVTAKELEKLNISGVTARPTRVEFDGGFEEAARANLWLRTAGRVRLVAGQYTATTFEELFEGCRALPWEDWIGRDMAFPVTARAVSSQLMSVPDIQKIVKKAVVERLKAKYNLSWLLETAQSAAIEAHIHKDCVTLSIDTSGSGLHLRGYRKLNGPAALRETLAAALVLMTKWQGDRPLADPCCGTGTIAVEGALYARNMAPGLRRKFAADHLPFFPERALRIEREYARDAKNDEPLTILASDIDDEALSMAKYHAQMAGVSQNIRITKADLRAFAPQESQGHIICNPPYGQRMGEVRQAEDLYRAMGETFRALPGWSTHIITSSPNFERLYGAPAHKRRQLKNGNIACRYFEYFARKP
ncbi:MAG: class I SAM-dependent RNA methyltransferase [Eubacteriales bacterium]|nr:class I SAM-dependent RNA methyltransferase [Eubacteriales bacterium]